MTIELAVLISIVSVAFSIFFGLKNNKRSDTKEIEERVRNDTKINIKLDNIGRTTQEIKNDIASMKSNISSHNDRLLILEQSCKSAHKRIDDVTKHSKGNDSDEQD